MNTDLIRKIYHLFVPERIQVLIDYKRRMRLYKLSRIVEKYYANKKVSDEEKKALSFLHRHHFNIDAFQLMYLSDNIEKYFDQYKNIPIYLDPINKLPYIVHAGKRLYFPKIYSDKQIRLNYAQFLYEMDKESPHLYCNNPDELCSKVLFDCGVAEGLFPLTYIDYLDKIVLFECDSLWIEALKATFEPYKEKVMIVNAYVSDCVTDNSITLDYFADNHNLRPTFIKMDIEGFEEKALRGASKLLLESPNLTCAICTYHTPEAETNIVNYMTEAGFVPSYNQGFMFFYFEEQVKPPYLRRGVVRFKKCNKTS